MNTEAKSDTLQSFAEQLNVNGFTVIPCLDEADLPTVRAKFDRAVASFPEFKPDAKEFVMGGFSAFGNPASFHNGFVREVRQWAMYSAVSELWKEYIPAYKTGYKLEQCIDRMMLRPKGKAPASESWHRDEAVNSGKNDQVFGGWINLDSSPQFFNCVPRSHTVQPDRHGGFARIVSDEEKKHHKRNARQVEIPAGHIIVFFEHIVHEVRAVKARYDMYRVFLGWRVTDDKNPLVPRNKAALKSLLADQAVMPLKSDQTPPMYAKLHWTNWRDKIQNFSDLNVVKECKTKRKVQSGRDAGTVHFIVPEYMNSLNWYGFRKYKPYSSEEYRMHVPNRSWTVLLPGRSRIFKKISL